jgi:gentisate 1,2-dioxygenase
MLKMRWSDANVVPLWENRLAHGGGSNVVPPMLWPWSSMRPLIERAATVTSTNAIERRVLSLVDPAYAQHGGATVRNLNAGLQILLPGETARPHRHSMNAIRFVIDGHGATTTVDEKICPMSEGDLVLTPAWTWHEHAHDGGERIVWLDVLDTQLHRFLDTDAFEPGPVHDVPDDGDGRSPSPVYHFPWGLAVEAVSVAPRSSDGARRVRYMNPATGGPVISLLDCLLWQLDPGMRTRPASTNAHAVCVVAEGSGTTRIGATTLQWGPKDVFTLPSGQPATHEATGPGVARLFVVSDREILRRLDLLSET